MNFGADLMTGSIKTGAYFFTFDFLVFFPFLREELLAVETRWLESVEDGSGVAATGVIATKMSLGNSTFAVASILVKSSPNYSLSSLRLFSTSSP